MSAIATSADPRFCRIRRFCWHDGAYREVVLIIDRGPRGACYELRPVT